MLQLIIPGDEYWDEASQEFVYLDAHVLELEYSLVAISLWESKWHKPFLSKEEMTPEEIIDFIKCMTLNNVNPDIYNRLTTHHIESVMDYMKDSMTATTFPKETGGKGNREIITSEIIYYWMVSLNMPIELMEKWHLSRLLTQIRVINIKNSPTKKMSRKEAMSQHRALNEARRKKLNKKG